MSACNAKAGNSPRNWGKPFRQVLQICPIFGASRSCTNYIRGFGIIEKLPSSLHPGIRTQDGSVRSLPGHTWVLGVAPPKGSGATFMCCLLPMFSSKMLAADNIADANAVISQTTDNSKDSKGAAEMGGSGCSSARVGDESPPYPITPSPRQTNGFWQRPSQTGIDSTSQVSTSDSEQRTRLRWAINIKQWNPWDDEWLFLLDMLPEEDQKEVEAFRFKEDQKRALVSRLLQRQCVAVALGIPWEKVLIKRTKGRKPFLINKGVEKSHAPNFNFNVSHEGDYVVLASEPISICGVDVAAPQQLRMRGSQQKMTITQLKSIFEKQFTPYEWASIDNAGSGNEAKEAMFRRLWSLKEALVKARGDGLGFDLSKAEFHFEDGICSDTASVWIDGQQQTRWRFFLQELSDGHWVSVARGPPENIVDAWQEFTGTLQQPVIPGAKFQEALEAPNPPFQMLQIADIIPQRLQDEYADAGGKV